MIYGFDVLDAEEHEVSLSEYKGKVLLIVNTATGCGFTPQYEGLEKLYDKYKDKGFEILDFPCNQFLGQAPGTNEEIVTFCQLTYGTTFRTFGKIDVNGDNADPLYKYLKEQIREEADESAIELYKRLEDKGFTTSEPDIKWNFTKFLIDKSGNVVARFAPTMEP